ncbi:uncharacterized protein LOC103842068 isoform X2 [Brassica rapa]|uniref:uncharacterized protein LOC103842068 isoform X2 n=1 Tax=Brassica campestris TaxID=3711 RepID=UPI00142D25CA|nr:uncharacterized protein LOC103842068 isoform X2 [Brassica rapa]
MACLSVLFPPLSIFPATMFAARVRASLKLLLHGTSLNRNREIVATSRRVVLDRFNDGDETLTSLRVNGSGVRTKLFNWGFHSSSIQCYSSESDVGVKAHTNMDDLFSELGSVKKDRNREAVVELLTKKPELSQKTKGKKKKKKKKEKHEQASDSVSKPKLLTEKTEASESVSKPKLLTEKPEASWTNGKSKMEAHASSPARNVTDSFSKPTESSSPTDHESKAQEEKETSSNGSSTSVTPSKHPSSVLVIRIGNLNSETTDSEIHSRCLSIGSFEGLARVSEDSVEVSFRARNMNEANSILKKLNKATVDHTKWTAEIVPEAKEASKEQMGMRISSSFEDMKTQLMMRQILVRDLEMLVHSVVHLENHPMDQEGTKALQCSQDA